MNSITGNSITGPHTVRAMAAQFGAKKKPEAMSKWGQGALAGLSALGTLLPGAPMMAAQPQQAPTTQLAPLNPGAPQIQIFQPNLLQKNTSLEARTAQKLLDKGGLMGQMSALKIAFSADSLNEAEKLSVIQQIFAKPLGEAPAGVEEKPFVPAPGADPHEMRMEEGMRKKMMEMELKQGIVSGAMEMLTAMKNDADRFHWLTSADSVANFLPLVEPLKVNGFLASLSPKAAMQANFQDRLQRWATDLSKSDNSHLRTQSTIAAFSIHSQDNTPVLRSNINRFVITTNAVDKADASVQLYTQFAAARFVAGANVSAAVKTQTYDEIVNALWEKQSSYSLIATLTAIKGMPTDEIKVTKLDEIFATEGVSATTDIGPVLAEVLSTFKPENKALRDDFIARQLDGKETFAKSLSALALMSFPDHPKFNEVISKMCRSTNTTMAKKGASYLPRLTDVALRKALTQELLNYQGDEMKALQGKLDAIEAQHEAIELEMEAENLTEAQLEALREKLLKAFEPAGELDMKLNNIVDVIAAGVQSLEHFAKDDPAFQSEMVGKFLEHSQGRVRYVAAKGIAKIESDDAKAALMRKATSVAGNAMFYTPVENPGPGELPFIEKQGQTPFESIAGSAAYTLQTLKNDDLKIQLMNEFAHHPVDNVKLAIVNALPTVKSGHEKLHDTMMSLAEFPKRVMGDRMPEDTRGWPGAQLNTLVQDLLKQGLELPQDDQESFGWKSRVMGAKLIKNMPSTMDKERADLVKTALNDRLEQVRYYGAMGALATATPEVRVDLIKIMSQSKDPFTQVFSMNLTQGLPAAHDTMRSELYETLCKSENEAVAYQARQFKINGIIQQEAAKQELPAGLLTLLEQGHAGQLMVGALQSNGAPWMGDLISQAAAKATLPEKMAVLQMLFEQGGQNGQSLHFIKGLMNDGDANIKLSVASLIGTLKNPEQKRELFNQLSQGLTEEQLGHAAMMVFGNHE